MVWGVRDVSDVGTEIRELIPIGFVTKRCAESRVVYVHGLSDDITATVCDRGRCELYELYRCCVPRIIDRLSQIVTEGSSRRLSVDVVQESGVVHV